MSKLLLNHKIHSFIRMKENEMPELKTKNVDQLIDDLVSEDRHHSLF